MTHYHQPMAQPRAARRRLSTPRHWTEALPGWIWLIVIASWTLVLYGRILQAPFVYDDLAEIVRNPNLADWHNVFTHFLTAPVNFTTVFRSSASSGSSYRPLYWLTLALDRHLWGLSPMGYHLTNLLLHALNGVLLLRLLRRARIAVLTSTAITLLWLSLPVNSEAVAWISARAYPLCLFCLLLNLLFTLRFLERRSPLALLAAFLSAIAALLSHESGIFFVPFAALILLLCRCNEPPALKQKATLLLFGTDLSALALFFLARVLVKAHSATGPSAPFSFALALWKYIGWILLPLRMSIERSTSTPPNTLSLPAIVAWIALALFIVLTIVLWKRLPSTAFGIAWLLISLAPFCGLIFLYQGMAERFCYIASVGAVIALVSLANAQRPPLRTILFSILALWAAWSIYRLQIRLSDWSSPAQLFRSSLQATPTSPSLWANLGSILRDSNEPSDAADAYRHALALNPNDAGTTLNLAVVLHQANQDEEAERTFRRAIALAPSDSGAYTDLGVLLYQQGRVEEAEVMFINAIDRNPADPTPYSNLALLYRQSGHPALALALYRKLLAIRPGDPDALANIQRLQNPH